MSDSVTPWIAACQASLSIINPGVHPNPHPSSWWCHPTISSSVAPFSSSPQSFPTSESFPMALHIRWPQYWSFSISPSGEYSRLISFRIDWFDLLAVQGTFRSLLQHHVQKHQFFGTQPSWWSSSHIHTWLLETPWHWLYWPLSAKWWLCFLIHCLGLSSLFFKEASVF